MLIILHGQDNFRAYRKLYEIISVYKAQNSIANVPSFNASELGFAELKNHLLSGTLFAGTRLFVIKELCNEVELYSAFKERILTHIAKALDTHLILFESANLAEDKIYVPLFRSASETHEFKKLSVPEATSWFLKEFNSIPNELIKIVVQICKADMWRTYNELKKLAAFSDGVSPSVATLERLGIRDEESQIFKTLDAIFDRRKDLAFEQLLLLRRSGEAPEYVMAMLERQLKILALVKEEAERGRSAQQIAKILALHPFVVKKTLALNSEYSWQRLQELYRRLATLDAKIKSGTIDNELACELLTAAIAS